MLFQINKCSRQEEKYYLFFLGKILVNLNATRMGNCITSLLLFQSKIREHRFRKSYDRNHCSFSILGDPSIIFIRNGDNI